MPPQFIFFTSFYNLSPPSSILFGRRSVGFTSANSQPAPAVSYDHRLLSIEKPSERLQSLHRFIHQFTGQLQPQYHKIKSDATMKANSQTSTSTIMSARQLCHEPPRKRRVMKKKVSFSSSSEMYVVTNLHDHNNATSRNSMWYTMSDISQHKTANAYNIVQTRMHLAQARGSQQQHQQRSCPPIPPPTNIEILGIEKYLSSNLTREHKRRKRQLFHAIGTEQVQQRLFLKNNDPDRLAGVSRAHSAWAMERAQMSAWLLQQDLRLSSSS